VRPEKTLSTLHDNFIIRVTKFRSSVIVGPLETFNKLWRAFPFLNKHQLKWIFSQYYLFDGVRALKDALSGKFELTSRTEFNMWNLSDFRIAEEVFQELDD